MCGQNGHLGPNGIQGVGEIFIVVGYEGTKRYMGFAVNAPENLLILLKGQSLESKDRNHLRDAVFLEEIRQGFHHAAVETWARVNQDLQKQAR
jgi:hypothetical protein